MQHGGRIVDLGFPGSPHVLELNYYPTTNRFYEPYVAGSELDHFGFTVDDIDGLARQFHRWRIPLVADFTERSYRLIFVRDPDGVWLEFGGRVRSKPAPRHRAG
jgi:catechol 2,3-dioxygenase-like lactoylglutathione lyase family enzyme